MFRQNVLQVSMFMRVFFYFFFILLLTILIPPFLFLSPVFPTFSLSQGGAAKPSRPGPVKVSSPSALSLSLSLSLSLYGEHQTHCGLFHAPCSPLWLNASRGFLLTSAF